VTDAGGLTSTKSSSVTVSNVQLRRPGAVQRRGRGPAVGRDRRRVVELHDADRGGKTVTFTISGGTGDADKLPSAPGAAPTTSTYYLPP
jgi:hypothetical protein